MSNIKRITLWVFLLMGSTFLFYLWSYARIDEINQMNNQVFIDNNHKNIIKKDINKNIYYQYSTSTAFQILLERGLDKNEWSTSTLKISTSTVEDYKDVKFIFPDSKSKIYIGCTYNIKLDLGENIRPNYIGVNLFDFGTKNAVSLNNSGLINSVTFKDSVFRWSVDPVWPGQYYLQIMLIDGLEIKIKSQTFFIEEKNNNNENC